MRALTTVQLLLASSTCRDTALLVRQWCQTWAAAWITPLSYLGMIFTAFRQRS